MLVIEKSRLVVQDSLELGKFITADGGHGELIFGDCKSRTMGAHFVSCAD